VRFSVVVHLRFVMAILQERPTASEHQEANGKTFKPMFEILGAKINPVVAFATAASCLACDDDHALNGRRAILREAA
jgi:hypothetical protein